MHCFVPSGSIWLTGELFELHRWFIRGRLWCTDVDVVLGVLSWFVLTGRCRHMHFVLRGLLPAFPGHVYLHLVPRGNRIKRHGISLLGNLYSLRQGSLRGHIGGDHLHGVFGGSLPNDERVQRLHHLLPGHLHADRWQRFKLLSLRRWV